MVEVCIKLIALVSVVYLHDTMYQHHHHIHLQIINNTPSSNVYSSSTQSWKGTLQMCDNPIIFGKIIVAEINIISIPHHSIGSMFLEGIVRVKVRNVPWLYSVPRYHQLRTRTNSFMRLSTKETVLGDVGGRNRCTALPYFPFARMCIWSAKVFLCM